MSKKSFNSVVAAEMRDFVALRKTEGKDYGSQAWNLVYFDRFLCSIDWQHQWLSQEVIDRYCLSIRDRAPGTQRVMLSVVRRFCGYMALFDPRSYVPERRRMPICPDQQMPFVFTQEQVCRLVVEAGRLPIYPSWFSLRPHLYETLVGLLYTTGIRVSEALDLNIEDVDLRVPRLLIRKGKFGKSRWIPLTQSTGDKLEEYLDKRVGFASTAPNSPVFVSCRDHRLTHSVVYGNFRRILRACGLARHAREGPNIHSLRHSFACHRLLEWYRQGVDINACLPALSTYMGHISIHFTRRYLHATPELLQEVHQRFLEHYRQLINSETDYE